MNYQAFARIRDDLIFLLYLLSDDNWNIEFTRLPGAPEEAQNWPAASGQTLPFSGGLDSLAGAVERLDGGISLQLASHYTHNPVISGSQRRLFDYLSKRYSGRVTRVAARMTGQNGGGLTYVADADRESSQRTRSFMFLVLGAIAARRRGFHDIVLIAENGQLAIHLPLTAARLGAFSTHTAHPEVVAVTEAILKTLLDFPLRICNPFLYATKAEVVAPLAQNHPDSLANSVTCWRSSRQAVAHCGECVPCLTRRIALEKNGVRLAEYGRDLLVEDIGSLDATDTGKRNLLELLEFVWRFGPRRSDQQVLNNYPDLHNDYFDKAKAIDMYRRFAREATEILTNYPQVAALLQ